MCSIFTVFLTLAACRRKKHHQYDADDDEPLKTAPEFGKVWHPDAKKWNHFVGREAHAVVAFIDDNPMGASISKMMESVLRMIDMSKINLVVAENWQIKQIIEDEGVENLPSIRFYKAGMKKWSRIYEGNYTPKSIAKWANDIVRELDEMEDEYFD